MAVWRCLTGKCLCGVSDIVHCVHYSEKRLVGDDAGADKLDTDKLRSCLFGGNVADYMRYLMEEDDEKYQRQFSKYIKANVGPDDVSLDHTSKLSYIVTLYTD